MFLAASRTFSGVDSPSLTPPASVLCRMSGDTILIATGPPILAAAEAACSGSRATISSGIAMP